MAGVHEKTVGEWVKPEYADPTKNRGYLETTKLGGRRYTTREALKQFQVQGAPIKRQSQPARQKLPIVLSDETERQLIAAVLGAVGIQWSLPANA